MKKAIPAALPAWAHAPVYACLSEIREHSAAGKSLQQISGWGNIAQIIELIPFTQTAWDSTRRWNPIGSALDALLWVGLAWGTTSGPGWLTKRRQRGPAVTPPPQ
jgi:hypothetical protein